MQNSRTMEIGVGMFVAGGLAALFMLAMQVSNLSANISGESYLVTAAFQNVGGLKVRSPVTVRAVFDRAARANGYPQALLRAMVTMQIEDKYNTFPEDTSASIFTAGLLGEQYISLQPGGSEKNLKNGDRIHLTQSALVMEQIIGQFLYNVASKESK